MAVASYEVTEVQTSVNISEKKIEKTPTSVATHYCNTPDFYFETAHRHEVGIEWEVESFLRNSLESWFSWLPAQSNGHARAVFSLPSLINMSKGLKMIFALSTFISWTIIPLCISVPANNMESSFNWELCCIPYWTNTGRGLFRIFLIVPCVCHTQRWTLNLTTMNKIKDRRKY